MVITGVGMVSPLGCRPDEVLSRLLDGERVAAAPPFNTESFHCKQYAPVTGFHAEEHFPDNKTLRMMNRDAQMAVVAARLAMQDAGVTVGETYAGEQIALYGSTGLTGLPVEEMRRLVQFSAAADGSLDLQKLGQVALKRVRPVLSFKILANIPICFVSIFEGIRGENGVYTPWEGHGAQAIIAGVRAVRHGRAECALVGGCDVKTHEFAFINLQQLGLFESWQRHGRGLVPGEGAAFLVLESEERALRRGARIYARISGFSQQTMGSRQNREDAFARVLTAIAEGENKPEIVASGDGDVVLSQAERSALERVGMSSLQMLRPKAGMGNLFAAAAAVQVGLSAEMARRCADGSRVLATCFGHGSGQSAFLLEAP